MTRILLDKSKEVRRAYIETHQDELQQLATRGQAPNLMYIGCCDSRVAPEPLVGVGPGDVFVVRTVANIIPPPESPVASVIGAALEFGIESLKIPHLAVCGHTDCGGILAIERGTEPATDHPHLRQWLEFAAELQQHPANGFDSPQRRHIALVEANVHLQRDRLMLYPVVAKAVAEKRIQVHAWYFDVHDQKMHYYDTETDAFLRE